jgi:hypothetical protein
LTGFDKLTDQFRQTRLHEARDLLGSLILGQMYVGETLAVDYDRVVVQVHDRFRKDVGGIPNLSFLVATRIKPGDTFDWEKEDSSVLLLRVVGSGQLPGDLERTSIRAEAGQRASGAEEHWDDAKMMDGYTANALSYAGLECSVIGTFYLSQETVNDAPMFRLRFGSDISNFYPNRGLKVYKPVNQALARIVNHRDPQFTTEHPLHTNQVRIGHVRYASTNRDHQGVDNVPFIVTPTDLLAQKTALFGMSRTGKSNTTKIIAGAVFNLRHLDATHGRVGQLIFDYNGEYANENVQDGGAVTPSALKNTWRTHVNGVQTDVVTYGTTSHPLDPDRKLMKINAFGQEPRDWADVKVVTEALQTLIIGKQTLDTMLETERGSKYIGNFVDADLDVPELLSDFSVQTRYRRAVLAYRSLLIRAGLKPQAGFKPNLNKLFSQDLRTAMQNSPDPANQLEYAHAAKTLGDANSSWDQVADAMRVLERFLRDDKESGYRDFNRTYATSHDGNSWHDSRFERILGLFQYTNGPRLVARLLPYHASNSAGDFTDAIYTDLCAGRLVIVDQSAGTLELNKAAADRVMAKIFQRNQQTFTQGEEPPDILVYIEEAHNLLPSSKEEDFQDVWVRTAKEGAKYRIGLIYATQEVSSIQKNILKNTANWFVAHLNNTDETRELRKFYDFADFERSILRAQDRGFLRVKTLSNLFIVPVQIQKFALEMVK